MVSGMIRVGWAGMLGILCCWGFPPASEATVGWETGDMVLDFGLNLESGESTVLVDKFEVGEPFFAELTWKLNPIYCRLEVEEPGTGENAPVYMTATDDGLFKSVASHAVFPRIESVKVTAQDGQRCEIQPSDNEFIVVARAPRAPVPPEAGWSQAPIGAVVIVLRATTFFLPTEVIINPGQKVVWIYADGAQEPHSVTSGGCRVNDCSGGGRQFNSGLTMNKPGHRFEHVFKHPGTFPYHCDLHLGSMQGAVTVQTPP